MLSLSIAKWNFTESARPPTDLRCHVTDLCRGATSLGLQSCLLPDRAAHCCSLSPS